jgi:hypothetical protein
LKKVAHPFRAPFAGDVAAGEMLFDVGTELVISPRGSRKAEDIKGLGEVALAKQGEQGGNDFFANALYIKIIFLCFVEPAAPMLVY